MKRIFAVLTIFVLAISAGAQNLGVKGTVTDTKGEPVPGAVVMLKGDNKNATLSDAEGKWSLQLPRKGTLVVTCMGYKDLEVSLSGSAVMPLVLEEDNEELDEVVVVGYGAMRRSDLTGALTSVKIDEAEAGRSMSMAEMLDGNVAGLEVLSTSTAPDAGINVRIRGISSFNSSTEPLYVVDGIIVNGESETMSTAISADSYQTATSTATNALATINPNDIASIEVLKDASATAIYGSQGANGVILITTKSATRERPEINVAAGVDVAVRDKRLDIMTFDEYVQYLEYSMPNTTAEKILNSVYSGYNGPDDRGELKVTPIDWQDYTLRTGVTQRYDVSVMGKPKGYNYRFSLGYKDNIGVLKGTDSKQVTARLNLDRTLSKKVKFGVKVGIAYVHSNLVNGSNVGGIIRSGTSLLRSILSSRPYVGVDPEIELDDLEDEDFQYGPNRWIQNYTSTTTRYSVQPSAYFQWDPLKWLSLRTTAGGDFILSDRVDARTYKITRIGTTAAVGRGLSAMYNWDTTAALRKKFGHHSLSGTLGFSMSRVYKSSQMNHGWYLEQPYAKEAAINQALPEYAYYGFSEQSNSLMSAFVRAIYNYRERYVLTATFRLDGSSKFMGANKWAGFPSFAFAWRPTSEAWFKVPWISAMKLRLGWGQVGNQNISNYRTVQNYATVFVGKHDPSSDSNIVGLYPTNIPNPYLRWETSQQSNAGLDIAFFKGRVSFTVDAYIKDTRDLLQSKNVARSSGFSTMYVNSGTIRNMGVEFTLDAVPVSTGGFEWAIGGNFALRRNKILSVGQSGTSGKLFITPDKEVDATWFSGNAINNESSYFLNINIEGQPIGLFYGFIADGILKNGETAPFFEDATVGEGAIRYRDLNGDGLLTEADQTIIGNPNPDFTYSFHTSFSYKGLSLKARFSGSYGADIYNLNNVQDYNPILTRNARAIVLREAYHPEKNPEGTFPKIGKFQPFETNINSTLFVEDGSFFTLRDLSLSYSLPINKKKSKVLKGVNIGLTGGNLFMITRYSGWTPKTKTSNVNRMGVELNSYPSARTFSLDVKFAF